MPIRKLESNHLAIDSKVLEALWISLRKALDAERDRFAQGGDVREFYKGVVQRVIPEQGLIDLSTEDELRHHGEGFAGFLFGLLTAQRLRELGMHFNIVIPPDADQLH